ADPSTEAGPSTGSDPSMGADPSTGSDPSMEADPSKGADELDGRRAGAAAQWVGAAYPYARRPRKRGVRVSVRSVRGDRTDAGAPGHLAALLAEHGVAVHGHIGAEGPVALHVQAASSLQGRDAVGEARLEVIDQLVRRRSQGDVGDV